RVGAPPGALGGVVAGAARVAEAARRVGQDRRQPLPHRIGDAPLQRLRAAQTARARSARVCRHGPGFAASSRVPAQSEISSSPRSGTVPPIAALCSRTFFVAIREGGASARTPP